MIAIIVYTVEVALPATPPAVSSGESATLRLPLSIINGDVLQTHATERPRGRACPVCSQLNRAGQRGGSGSSVPRPAVCVRASSHTSSNNGKKEVSTTTTQKAMRGPWTCGASKMGRNKKREDGGKNLGPSLIGEGHTQAEGAENRKILFSRIQPSETLDFNKSFSKCRPRKWRVRNWLGSPVGVSGTSVRFF